MRKPVLTYSLISLALIVIAFCIVASRQPDTFRIERSATMTAPPATVFAQMNDLHNWKNWSPWADIDPATVYVFEGPQSGLASSMTWKGNRKAGEGKMTILESRPNEFVRIQLNFTKPFASNNTVEFTLVPQGQSTAVTWMMTGPNNFMFKAFHSVINMDKLVGPDFERGLAKLKTVAEAKQP